MRNSWQNVLIICSWLCLSACRAQENYSALTAGLVSPSSPNLKLFEERPPGCPPCFNCNLDEFQCQQFGNCSSTSGRCGCPPGFGGPDCAEPLCGSLAKGKNRKPRPADLGSCECDEGWSGINCNVCNTNDACAALMPEKKDGICYKQGLVQKQNFQMCGITNKKIVDQLDPKRPTVTFSCTAESAECNFQFWVEEIESFYCALDTCKYDMTSEPTRNITKYECEHIKCKCVPDRMLCGADNAIDIGEFLESEIKGPATFTTISTEGGSLKDGSSFSEPAMNGLISSVFGDESITLDCNAGECLYRTDVPGYAKPVKKINTPLIAGVIAGCSMFVVGAIILVWYMSRRSANDRYALYLNEDEDENAHMTADHRPASLLFQNVSYHLNGRQILDGVQGGVHSGELMAIMGASGAGKTTFLDILARKNKKGVSGGDFYVNGEQIPKVDFKSVIGFVDQDDYMLPTLTVYETILDSAKLRLPKDMSLPAKQRKVEDVMKQLGIVHIRDSIIGSEESNGRGISGGEKRRVGIACELVTSPSILFLDEPTSGLDAYNAFNVIECLSNLVKSYNRTVIFTIHQPRSNIVALFDQIILLAKGRTVYSGPFAQCQEYFDNMGYSCPPGFNIADYLVDLIQHVTSPRTLMDDVVDVSHSMRSRSSSMRAVKSVDPSISMPDATANQHTSSFMDSSSQRLHARRRLSVRQQLEGQLFSRKKSSDVRPRSPTTTPSEEEASLLENPKQNFQAWMRLSKQSAPARETDEQVFEEDPNASGLDSLIYTYLSSNIAAAIRKDIRESIMGAKSANGASNGDDANGSIPASLGKFRGYHKVGIFGQFLILSTRTWRNLYRNPMLMLTHYAIAIVLAVFLGFLFYGLGDDIAGFQNRLGLFFFILALFGFSTLTTLSVFGPERLLFTRERAKGYYRPIAYFGAKVVFDIVPLRVIPPIILGTIVYPMTGLIPGLGEFSKFILFLVLFNLAAATMCLFVGVVFRNGAVANLVGSLVMLFSLLFSGFLLNHQSIPKVALWLQVLSIFHYGFEGLIVNEVKYLSLTDHKYGLDIEVPGSAILSSFGFNTQALWADVTGLAVFAAVFMVVAYGAVHILLVERR